MKKSLRLLVLGGALQGFCFALSFGALDLLSYGGFTVQGIGADAASRLAAGAYLRASVEAVAGVWLAYIVIFVAGGVIARGIHWAIAGNGPLWRVFWQTSLLQLALHLLCFSRAAIQRPQLYEALFERWHLHWLLELLATPFGLAAWAFVLAAFILSLGRWLLVYRFQVETWAAARGKLRSWQRATSAGVVLLSLAVAIVGSATVLDDVSGSAGPDGHLPKNAPSVARDGAQQPARARASFAQGQGRHVIFVGIDSLRSDRLLGPAGATRAMPYASELLRQYGQGFGNVVVPLARTFPSWVSLLTSQHPRRHGVTTMFPRQVDRSRPPPTVTATLEQHGFFTAVYSDFAGDIFGRYPFGFREVHAPTLTFPVLIHSRVLESATGVLPYLDNATGRALFPSLRELAHAPTASELVDACVSGLSRRATEDTFSVLFFSDAHFPYSAPYPAYMQFREPGYSGPNAFQFRPAQMLNQTLSEHDLRQVRGLYDGGLWSIDRNLRRLVELLKERGMLERTLLVISADHGENLGENQLGFAHGNHLLGVAEHQVPFVWVDFSKPAPAAIDRERQVSSLDVAPTLLDLLGLPPQPTFEGRSLLEPGTEPHPVLMETGLWFVERGQSREIHQNMRMPYPSVDRVTMVNAQNNDEIELRDEFLPVVKFAKHVGWQAGDERLVYVPLRPTPAWHLFDTRSDPLSEHDLARARPERVAQLQEAMLAALRTYEDVRLENGFLFYPNPTP
jgi:arylsulfatase A-like enzyme